LNRRFLDLLDANLAVFGHRHAQALEYWLDDSMYSHWRRPAQQLLFSQATLEADVNIYGKRGIRNVTSFAVFIDAEYVARFGFPEAVQKYGKQLADWRRG
jgi:hypothetical protein